MQNIQGFVTLVNWKINQAEITEKYCENKAKKEMKCNGKCYLAKQLKLQEDNEQSDLSKKHLPKLKKSKEVEYFPNVKPVQITSIHNSDLSKVSKSNFIDITTSGFHAECFHPPQV
jgi:hypothetical protein